MTETDPDRLADELEQDADNLEERSGEVHDEIDQARSDWARKRRDPAVPGAVPEPGEGDGDGDDERDPDASAG